MNTSILNIENQEFIDSYLDEDISKLLFKKHLDTSVDIKLLIEQIEAKKRCRTKLPTWFHSTSIIYPNKLNIEQTSSEITANYKANLINGSSLVDLTGGFGVDSYYFSKRLDSVTHCEIDSNLSEIVKHNFHELGVKNIQCINENGITYLEKTDLTLDWIYVDPSRRHESKGKVFFLNDCLPNVPKHLDLLFSKSNNILIKTSPLLDISVGINELNHVKSVHIIAVKNEVKELLWILENGYNGPIDITAANIKKEQKDVFSFNLTEESNKQAPYAQPLTYLFEPNSAILKAGAFNSLAIQFNLFKLQKHTHLYTSEHLIQFPGRAFKIEKVVPYNKKELKELNITQANVSIRNFPETVQQIRKKFKIKDGGNTYLFFTTNDDNNRIVIVCKKTKKSLC